MFKLRVFWVGRRIFYDGTHLWAGQMPDIGEPADMSTTVIEGVNELVGGHSVHVRLAADVILAQNNLGGTKPEMSSYS